MTFDTFEVSEVSSCGNKAFKTEAFLTLYLNEWFIKIVKNWSIFLQIFYFLKLS